MSVLRELVAFFKVDYDRSGARAADRDLDRLKKKAKGTNAASTGAAAGLARMNRNANLASVGAHGLAGASGKLTKALGFLGVAYGAHEAARGLYALNTMASDANETANLLGITFEDSADDVAGWSEEASERLGRSMYDMQESAAQIGSLLKAAFGDEGLGEVRDISQELSERIIDLASARNLTEDDALQKMMAGLAGEAEPLRRVGVDVTVGGIADVMGLDKNWNKNASRAEQFAIRYAAIMQQTAQYHGDAAKTADEQANAERALSDHMKDLGTQLGFKLLPYTNKITVAMRDFADSMVDLVKDTNAVEAAVYSLGAVLVGVGVATIGTWGPIAGIALLAALGFGALFLLVEDIITGMEDGKSVTGEFLDELLGIEDVLPKFKSFWVDAKQAMDEFFNGGHEAIDRFEKRLDELFSMDTVDRLTGFDKLHEGIDKTGEDFLDLLGVDTSALRNTRNVGYTPWPGTPDRFPLTSGKGPVELPPDEKAEAARDARERWEEMENLNLGLMPNWEPEPPEPVQVPFLDDPTRRQSSGPNATPDDATGAVSGAVDTVVSWFGFEPEPESRPQPRSVPEPASAPPTPAAAGDEFDRAARALEPEAQPAPEVNVTAPGQEQPAPQVNVTAPGQEQPAPQVNVTAPGEQPAPDVNVTAPAPQVDPLSFEPQAPMSVPEAEAPVFEPPEFRPEAVTRYDPATVPRDLPGESNVTVNVTNHNSPTFTVEGGRGRGRREDRELLDGFEDRHRKWSRQAADEQARSLESVVQRGGR